MVRRTDLRLRGRDLGDDRTSRAAKVLGGGLLALAVGGSVMAVYGGGGGTSAADTPTPVPTAPPAASQEPPVLPPADLPLLAVPRLRWERFAGVALPYSTTAGPMRTDGSVHSGYERSQTGALVAAAQIGTRYLLTPGDGWRQVVERQVLQGGGRDAFVQARGSVVLDDPPGSYGQPAGFRFVTFSPDVAVVQLVSRFPQTGALQLSTTTVRWIAGDWRLELQPDGGTSPTVQAVPDLTGFVAWGL